MPTKLTNEIINAAIVGFEQQKLHIDTQIAELRAMLDGGSSKPTPAATPATPTIKRRKFSAAARRRMKEAQQRRWAKIKGESEHAPQETSRLKRKLSAAGRERIIAATKKRWAAVRAGKAQQEKAGTKNIAAKNAGKKIAAKKQQRVAAAIG